MSTYKLNTFTSKPTSTTTDDQLEGISCFSFFDRVIRKSLQQKIHVVVLDSSWRPHLGYSFVSTKASLNVVNLLGCMSHSTESFESQHVQPV